MWFLKGSRRLLDFYLVSGIQWPIDHFFQFAVIDLSKAVIYPVFRVAAWMCHIDLSKAVIYPVFRVAVWMCRMAMHGFKIDCCVYLASLWCSTGLSGHFDCGICPGICPMCSDCIFICCVVFAGRQHLVNTVDHALQLVRRLLKKHLSLYNLNSHFCDCSVMLNLSLLLDYFIPV